MNVKRGGINPQAAFKYGLGLRPTRMLSSSPIEAGSSPDWHLAGLLTHASANPNAFPRARSQWLGFPSFGSQRSQLRGSGGFTPRFPTPDEKIVYHVKVCRVKNA
jgi:hypothetical protein